MVDRNKITLTKDEQAEVRAHGRGTLIFWAGMALMVCACAGAGGFIGIVGVGGILVGFFMWVLNRSEYKIRDDKALAQTVAENPLAAAKVAVDMANKNYEKAKEKEETKKIVKGAVVGGIIAGDAGAIVGATIAKNKIDNEKGK